jgi:hypothetical protein
MKFGLFYEHQLPQPWGEESELRLYQQALDQIELADRLGIDYVWEVEHHFLEEYSHSSAPEVFLAACSQRTKRIRLGHGITLMPPNYNHPARVAERIATLDLVSNGRVEWGTGESATAVEMGGFGVDPDEKRAMWRRPERPPTCWRCGPIPGSTGAGSRCRAATWCRKQCSGRTRQCGWRARGARPFTSPHATGSAR